MGNGALAIGPSYRAHPRLYLDLRTLTEERQEQVGRKPEVVPGVFAEWQLSGAIAPSTLRRANLTQICYAAADAPA